MEHAADPGAIGHIGQRDGPIPDRLARRNAHVGCGNAVDHAAQNREQIDEVANRQPVGSGNSRDLRVEANTRAVRKESVVYPADINAPRRRACSNAVCEECCSVFPVEGYTAGFGEVVPGSCRNNAQRGIRSGTHNAIGRLVDTAVTARNDETPGATVDRLLHLCLEMADALTQMDFDRQARLAEQFPNACVTLASAPPPGGRVKKQVDGLDGHLPMLQCAGLFSQNGRRMLELGVKFLISYFIGSLMGAMIVGKLRGGIDIRTMGSGNAGGTNAFRTQGVIFALGVVVVDVGKGVIGAGLVPGLDIPFVPQDPEISRTWLTLVCAAGAVLGHVWPIYHGFKGGKGAATLIGTLIILAPKLIIGVLLVWGWVLVMTGYVGLATMTAASALPVWLALKHLPDNQPLFIYLTVMALFVIYWHRSNIRRMRDGVEHRNVKVMLFKPRESTGANDQS